MTEFSNEDLLDFAREKFSLSNLEEILYNEKTEFERLKQLKRAGDIKFGKLLTEEEMKKLAFAVMENVNEFLSLENGEMPEVQYNKLRNAGQIIRTSAAYVIGLSPFVYTLAANPPPLAASLLWYFGLMWLNGTLIADMSHYANSFYDNGTLIIKKNTKAGIVGHVAHEFAHHLQHEKGISFENSVLTEGHAAGIHRHISKLYYDREGDLAFLYKSAIRTVYSLKEVYNWLCSIREVTPKLQLMRSGGYNNFNQPLSEQSHEMYAKNLYKPIPSAHYLGEVLFYLKEVEDGKDIYKKLLDGTFTL